MEVATPGKRTIVSCNGTGKFAFRFNWFRPNNGTPELIISCNMDTNFCRKKPGLHRYHLDMSLSTQQSKIMIDSFDAVFDAGYWSCKDGMVGVGQTTCLKEPGKSKYFCSV